MCVESSWYENIYPIQSNSQLITVSESLKQTLHLSKTPFGCLTPKTEHIHSQETKLKMKQETVTLVLVNLAGIMERADQSLLPGVYKEIGAVLNADPTALGSLTLNRSLVQSFCYPLAAYLATRLNRAHAIALGAFLWPAATFLVAISPTFLQIFTHLSNDMSFFYI